ncbi:MAG: hypothetical protein R3A48_20840 [Polyangiales bacterium]
MLVNIANCYLALEDPHQAISYFDRFLSDPTNNASPQQRQEIQQALLSARRRLAQVNVVVIPAGAEVFVDGDLVGSAPLRRPVELGPGPHVVEARRAGAATQQYQARLEAGSQLTVTLDLLQGRSYVGTAPSQAVATAVTPTPPTPTPVVTPPPVAPVTPPPAAVVTPPTVAVVTPPEVPAAPPATVIAQPASGTLSLRGNDGVVAPRSRGPGAGFWITLGLTVGFGATATGFAVYAENLASDFQVIARAHNVAPPGQQRDLLFQQATNYAAAVDQNRTIAIIMGGAAGASAIAAVILLVTGGSSSSRRAVTVGPAALGHGASLNLAF